MKPSDIYQRILLHVCSVTGLNERDVLHGNVEECSDARSILVQSLSLFFNDLQIASMIGRTRRGVNFIRTHFDVRLKKWSVANNWEAIRKRLRNDWGTIGK